MLKVLIVCNSGTGTSVMLKSRLEKIIPEHTYTAAAVTDVATIAGDYDVIMTFETLESFVRKAAGSDANIKTVEKFNLFATNLFNEFLQG